MFNSVQSGSDRLTTRKHYHILGRLIQNQTLTFRPRLGKAYSSSSKNPDLHTAHYISFKEFYNHLFNTVVSQDDVKTDAKDIQRRLTQYFGTMLRGRTTPCSRAVIILIYTLYTFDKYYCDKSTLPNLLVWGHHKVLNEIFKKFWFEVYNHANNFSKDAHPRTNLMIRTRRDLVYTNGIICETVHSKLGQKWNNQLKNLKKNQTPVLLNLPIVPNDFIGTKYTGVFDSNGQQQMDQEKLAVMLEAGYFVLSSHAATTPRYRLPLSDNHKEYHEQFDQNYYDRDNDNFDVKMSSRTSELELTPDNMTEEEKVHFKAFIKDVLAKEKDILESKKSYTPLDTNDLPLNNDIEEPMPPPNPKQSFVYCGYVIKPLIKGLKSPSNSSKSFSFGFSQ